MQTKGDKSSDIEDPLLIQAAFRDLLREGAEFHIKVQGASTLPYAASIQALQPGEGGLIIKLVRPLPHELIEGATFTALFSLNEQRFSCELVFKKRHEYLQYRFDPPSVMTYADRRRSKRYPFRPRERAYLMGQDGGLPGLGIAGPVVNICMEGIAIRLDRVIKLADNVRVPPNLAVIERGKDFSKLRIQDLPKLPLLECRAMVTHCTNCGGATILGLSFMGLSPEAMESLEECIQLREKRNRGAGLASGAGSEGRLVSERPHQEHAVESGEGEPSLDDALVHLQRRSTRLLLAMIEGDLRACLSSRLAEIGYGRLEYCQSMDALEKSVREDDKQFPIQCLLVDASLAQKATPEAALTYLEGRLASLGLPFVMLCDQENVDLLVASSAKGRVLAIQQRCKAQHGDSPTEEATGEEDLWLTTLDALTGLRE